MPFDDSTLIGYTLTMINQLLGSWMTCLVIYNVDSLFFGICFYIETMLDDKCYTFHEIDNYLKERKKMARSMHLKMQLQNVVLYHTKILEWVRFKCYSCVDSFAMLQSNFRFAHEFENLMSGIVFVTFSTSIMWICTSLFQIQEVFCSCY